MATNSLQHCFVIMSFSDNAELEKAYRLGMKRTLGEMGFECVRVDEAGVTSRITESVEKLIKNAYFVIADVTEQKRNCYYELGYAYGTGRPVLLLAREGTELDFDINHFPCTFYQCHQDLRTALQRRIRDTVLKSPNRDWDDYDPLNGRFGRIAIGNGRLLTGKVLKTYEDPDGDDDCNDVRLRLISLPGRPRLSGSVRFVVHPDYSKRGFTEKVKDGYAECDLEAVGRAFTVGADADGGKTKLELYLGSLPGGSLSFYADDH
jgi:nucleoside 2-deoxyribosyltransferase